MLLTLDVGNTQTVVGVFAPGGAEPEHHWRVSTVPSRTADEMALLLSQLLGTAGLTAPGDLEGMAVASVVPRLRAALRSPWAGLPTLVVEPGVRTGMPILYDNPREVGADRIADAVAAFEAYGGPTIVVDFGTAITFEVVSAAGEYLGGVIVPGMEISQEALFARAALLPRVEMLEPGPVLAKNTVDSVRSGAIYGTAALVDGLVGRLHGEVGPATVVATGGMAGLIAPYTSVIDHHDPWLTLRGLRLIFERNRSA